MEWSIIKTLERNVWVTFNLRGAKKNAIAPIVGAMAREKSDSFTV